MAKYEVRLESETNEQSRVVTLSAPTEKDAVALCESNERGYAAYSLKNDLYLPEGTDWASAYSITPEGKVVGPKNSRYKARIALDAQENPYKVVSVERRVPDLDRLVSELTGLTQDEVAWAALLDRLKENGTPLAAVTAFMFGVPVKNQYDGTSVVDWDTDTIKVALLTAYSENQDTHDFFNDASGAEITGTGYTAGGASLGSKTATYDTASDQTRLDAADTTWTTSTLSSTECVVYKDTGTGSTSPLIGFVDFGGTVSTTAGTFQITWDSTGIIVIDVT